MSGSVVLGIPQRCANKIAACADKDEFLKKHKTGQLNIPLLCHVRVSRTVRQSKDGALTFVNHTLEGVEFVTWEPQSAPNAAYTDVLSILNNCPEHDQGILFAFLADIHPDPHYGLHLVYDGQEGPKGAYVAALVASTAPGRTEKISEDGYKIVTTDVKDIANPEGTLDKPTGSHTLVGYCSAKSLPAFSLEPPRNKTYRFAIVFLSKCDTQEGLFIYKLEYIEPHEVKDAVECMTKLRRLCKGVQTNSSQKRFHSVALEHEGVLPNSMKKARVLQAMPTDSSLPE